MNNLTDLEKREQNEKWVRLMAVIGFVVIICLLAWLAVQVVRFMPTIFSSLANVFEANQREYTERTDGNVIIVDEPTPAEPEPETPPVVIVVEEPVETPATPAPTAPATPAATSTPPRTSTAPAPVQYKTIVTHTTPVSNPNGFTDLQVTFSGVGRMTDANRFVAATELGRNELSAMQFVVKNIGTKTSGDWSFVAELPNGSVMTSRVQLPLKPQESATLTVLFTSGDHRGTQHLGATAIGGNDANLTNNGFRTSVSIR